MKQRNHIHSAVGRGKYSAPEVAVRSVFTIETSKSKYEYVTKKELNLTDIDFQSVPFDLSTGKVVVLSFSKALMRAMARHLCR